MAIEKRALLGVLAAWLCAGCMGQQTARLYDMKTGQVSTLSVDGWVDSGGKMRGTLPSGAACQGSFSALSAKDAQAITKTEVLFTENADSSVGVMQCGADVVLRCTMARRPGSGFSYGLCTDQRGAEYSMMF